jgi:WS/DGAT/MGAT family acyltransferase
MPSVMQTVAKALCVPAGDGRQKAGNKPAGAPETPFNQMIKYDRSYAMASLPLSSVKAIGRACGATVNDVVLTLCAGALRRYLAALDALPTQPLIAAVPYSLRAADNAEMGNQVTFMLSSLATHLDDPLQRLASIQAATGQAKSMTGNLKSVMSLDYPTLFAPWLVSGLSRAYSSGLATVLPSIANLVISNIHGSAQPLYLAGARVKSFYPVSIPFHGHALNISVQSYVDSLDFGFTACRRSVPNVAQLAEYLHGALEELAQAVFPPDAASRKMPPKARKAAIRQSADAPATEAKRKRTIPK